jgi:hypothetical protein
MGKPARAISIVLPVRQLIVMVLCVLSCSEMQKEPDRESVRRKGRDVRQFFRQDLENENPFYAGLARLYLGSELREGNTLIRQALSKEIRGAAESIGGPATGITPEIAASEYFKWQMRNWVLVYYLFYQGSRVYPGRLEAETQTRIEELFWNYLRDAKNHTIRRAELKYVFDIHGSENHELMRYSNLLLAAQALKNIERYRDLEVADGLTVDDYFTDWNTYYREYPLARARYGDMTEIFSMYCVYSLPELFNLYDYAEDPVTRKRMKMLLDLIWADWAIAQINGIRGGVKTRIYQDPEQPDGREMERGGKDARWKYLSWIVFARENWWRGNPLHVNSSHRIQGATRVLASSAYELPGIIRDMADDRQELGEFVYMAVRPAKQRALPLQEIPVWYDPYYSYDRDDPRMLSYEYCTPDFIMGCLVIDPTLPLVPSHLYYTDRRQGNREGYPALSTQNRYQSIIFPTDSTARVLPQCVALKDGVTYGQQQAIQHRNIMLVQRDVKAENTGDMRIFFSEGMKDRLVDTASWLFLEEGNALLGVRAFTRKDGRTACRYQWDNDFFIRLDDRQAPVVFILGRKARTGDMATFRELVLASSSRLEASGKFTFSGTDMDGELVSLSLYLNGDRLPEVNGTPVNLSPEKIYDSPYLSSVHGSGIVNIHKGDRELILDFN